MTNKKKKQFLKIPILEGGNQNLRKFVEENLIYPEEALKNKIEGLVHLSYSVDDYGNILDIKIEKGLGFGCDEEAIRLVKLQSFSKVKNKGVRVKISQKAKIAFKLKNKPTETTINYTIVSNTKTNGTTSNKTFSYSINIEKV